MKSRIALMMAVALTLPLAGLHAAGESCAVKDQNLTGVAAAGQGPLKVGEYVETRFDSPRAYPGSSGLQAELVFTQEIYHQGATYVAPHFSRMELAPGDYVIVRSPDYERSWRYEGYGKKGLGKAGGPGFWGIHISGPMAIVELWSARGGAYGFTIDRYGRGYTDAEMGFEENGESICTADDKVNSICYETSEPDVYESSRAITRLLIDAAFLCTGWLVGDEGHMMTNEHCISTQSSADNTDYEFMAEGATCAENCPQLGCDGTIEATSATLIQDSVPLDYALVLLPTNQSGTYGFTQMQDSAAQLGEIIYSVQHPGGRGKEIALVSTYPANVSGLCEVDSLTEPPCDASSVVLEVGYWMDTEGGSSGSPVFAYDDGCVVALHHCRGSAFCSTGVPANDDPNRGVPTPAIIADLGANLPNNALCVVDAGAIFDDDFESGDTGAWSVTVP